MVGCAVFLGLAVIVGVWLLSSGTPDKPPTDGALAAYSCGQFIKNSLRDPSSVEWVTDPALMEATKQPDGNYTVLISLRANNGFGGKNLTAFTCTVSKDAKGDWQLVGLTDFDGT